MREADEIREAFLSFFESKGHKRLPGASLVPKNDPTLLLTGAGMVPFKPYFLGKAKPDHTRVTTCQPCVRTPDIESVGKDDRHATFFEMLGNFSFGDYFKGDAIFWAWEFVTQYMKLPPEKLWVTIYLDDDEAFKIWHEKIGVPAERILRLGKQDNFWEIGVGPCGPCSEIHVDRGPQYGCGKPDCKPGCSCDRFMEIWNLVFIQFHKDEQGQYHPLEKKSIDTGMGLERAAVILGGLKSIFDADHIRPIVDYVGSLAGVRYNDDPQKDVSLRVITDHSRGITFMVSDGILPGNEGRGYVLRRILRRAVRHGRLLGIEGPFMEKVAGVVIDRMKGAYPQLQERRQEILRVIRQEEERFQATLDQGMTLLADIIEGIKAAGGSEVNGAEAFRLYDTYGFPLELTREIAAEHELVVDEQGFQEALDEQRERARSAREDRGYLDKEVAFFTKLAEGLRREHVHGITRFVGYETPQAEATILALIRNGQEVDQVAAGEEARVILDTTPFYAESGGQVADTGVMTTPEATFQVEDVRKPAEDMFVHYGKVTGGKLYKGMMVSARIDVERRLNIARNHTSTHLLQKALQEVLGDHAHQAGSLVSPDRLRFDFNHFAPVTDEQLRAVERIVNRQILNSLPVTVTVTTLEEAQKMGAMALFEAKYGDKVRLVNVGNWSLELCGGTHLTNTSQAGLFRIIDEGGVAAGIRRIEAVTGESAFQEVEGQDRVLREVCQTLKASPAQVASRVSKLQDEIKNLQKEIAGMRKRLAGDEVDRLIQEAEMLGNNRLVVASVGEIDAEGLRQMSDRLREKLGSGVVVLGATYQGKVNLLAVVSKDLTSKVQAGDLVREAAKIVGGGGGGRPDMAQAGGKEPDKLPEAMAKAGEMVRSKLA